MRPTVGRIVHFYDEGSVGPFAAIVTQTGGKSDTHVALEVFWPPALKLHRPASVDNVPFHEPSFGSGYWVWPSRSEV